MDSSKLTREQTQQMHDAIKSTQGYLQRAIDRMDETSFPADDPLRKLVTVARDALLSLTVHLHYHSCGMINGGAGMTRHLPPSPSPGYVFDPEESSKADYARRRGCKQKGG